MGKKGKAKAEPEPYKPIYNHPEHLELSSNQDTREVVAKIKMATPVCPILELEVKCTPQARISYIVDLIVDRHYGTLNRDELNICVNRFHPEEICSHDSCLHHHGVSGGECIIYYDYLPYTNPLLEGGFEYLETKFAQEEGKLGSTYDDSAMLKMITATDNYNYYDK